MCSSGVGGSEPQVWCFQCGAGYAAEVASCVECGVATVNSPPADATEVGEADEEQFEYDFHGHSSQSRSMMESLLLGAGLPHAWQGAVLIVREADEEQVDEFVTAIDLAAAPVLPDDAPRVAYELQGLDDAYMSRLTDALDAAGIAYGFDDDGDLEVAAVDEARVDGLFDRLADGDDGAGTAEFGPVSTASTPTTCCRACSWRRTGCSATRGTAKAPATSPAAARRFTNWPFRSGSRPGPGGPS